MSSPPPDQPASPPEPAKPASDFASQAEDKQPGLLAELFDFLWYYKLWWVSPIVLVLTLVGVLIFLSGTAAAPFIYPLF